MTLHDAIVQVLLNKGHPMTTQEIADELNQNGLYSKKDGSLISAFQIHGRTRNYRYLFDREGSIVSLKSKTGISKPPAPQKTKQPFTSISTKPGLLAKVLMNEKNFKSASDIDDLVPEVPGMYCIRIKDSKALPKFFGDALAERNHNIIYIGIASQSLKKRFLGQELRANGHGTFFRSIGAVLGYRPIPGSLREKKNKNNYAFSKQDELKIIKWINANLLVNWIAFNGSLNGIENELIREYVPLLNIAGNPAALPELQELREECKRVAVT